MGLDEYSKDSVTPVTRKTVTLPGVKTLLTNLINGEPNRTFTTRELVSRTGRRKGAIRVALSRLAKEGKVRRVDQGLYQSPASFVRPTLPDPRLRIHNVKLEARCNEMGGRPYPRTFQRVTLIWGGIEGGPHRHPNNHSITGKGEWEARILTWTLHPESVGLLEVFLEASSNPLHLVLDFPRYLSAVVAVTGIPSSFWMIRQADWNIDIPGKVDANLAVAIEKRISIAGFGAMIVQVYQKAAELVRFEIRDFHPLGADEISEYVKAIYNALGELVKGGIK